MSLFTSGFSGSFSVTIVIEKLFYDNYAECGRIRIPTSASNMPFTVVVTPLEGVGD